MVLQDEFHVFAIAVGMLGILQLMLAPKESVADPKKANGLVHVTMGTLIAALAGGLWSLWQGALLEVVLFGIVVAFEAMTMSTAKRRQKQAQVFENIFTD